MELRKLALIARLFRNDLVVDMGTTCARSMYLEQQRLPRSEANDAKANCSRYPWDRRFGAFARCKQRAANVAMVVGHRALGK